MIFYFLFYFELRVDSEPLVYMICKISLGYCHLIALLCDISCLTPLMPVWKDLSKTYHGRNKHWWHLISLSLSEAWDQQTAIVFFSLMHKPDNVCSNQIITLSWTHSRLKSLVQLWQPMIKLPVIKNVKLHLPEVSEKSRSGKVMEPFISQIWGISYNVQMSVVKWGCQMLFSDLICICCLVCFKGLYAYICLPGITQKPPST